MVEAAKQIDPIIAQMLERRERLFVDVDDAFAGKATQLLDEEGVVAISDVCDPHNCDRLVLNICRLRETAPTRIDQPEFRSDWPQYYGGYASQIFLDALSVAGVVLGSRLGENPLVSEFSCMISYPGAERQNPHPDVRHGEGVAEMYTVFIPLIDQNISMGPLMTWPKTHLEFPTELRISDGVPMMGHAGTIVIMNSKLFHCGGKNVSDRPRPVFYFTLQGEGPEPLGSTLSILPEFKGMRVKDFLDMQGNA